MLVRILGCSGSIAKNNHTSSFLVDEHILLDAGTGLGELDLQALLKIDHLFITHSHLDHVAMLPLLLDTVMASRAREGRPPILVYALAATIAALRKHIFNRVIWPDFTRLPSEEKPVMRFVPILTGQAIEFSDLPYRVEVMPAVHSVPAVGYCVQAKPDAPALVYSGDTATNPAFWQRINSLNMGALIIETAFSNKEAHLAQMAQHLSPSVLANELDNIAVDKKFPIFITHTKPAESEQIMREIEAFDAQGTSEVGSEQVRHDIRWLKSGQVIEI